MSILSRNLIPNPTSRFNLITSRSHNTHIVHSPKFSYISNSNHLPNPPHLQIVYCERRSNSVTSDSLQSHRWRIRVSESSGLIEENQNQEPVKFNFEYLLSLSELALLVSSFVVSVGCLVSFAFFKQRNLGLVALGDRVLVWLLAGAVVLGAAIRRRQWRRICGVPVNRSALATDNVNVIERVEKLEESLRNATTIIRVLSRQLEKLGIWFRVTRRTLKDPIAETAALAQKNSEITRTLAAQEDRLEKELGEVQKVLLAMQDQQQKQLELILAIVKNGKLLGPEKDTSQGSHPHELDESKRKGLNEQDSQQVQVSARQKGKQNDKV